MLVTALSPHIGYESAARVAQLAFQESITLREVCARLGLLTEDRFDAIIRPKEMV